MQMSMVSEYCVLYLFPTWHETSLAFNMLPVQEPEAIKNNFSCQVVLLGDNGVERFVGSACKYNWHFTKLYSHKSNLSQLELFFGSSLYIFFKCMYLTEMSNPTLSPASKMSKGWKLFLVIKNEHNEFCKFQIYCRVIALHYIILHCTGVQQWP